MQREWGETQDLTCGERLKELTFRKTSTVLPDLRSGWDPHMLFPSGYLCGWFHPSKYLMLWAVLSLSLLCNRKMFFSGKQPGIVPNSSHACLNPRPLISSLQGLSVAPTSRFLTVKCSKTSTDLALHLVGLTSRFISYLFDQSPIADSSALLLTNLKVRFALSPPPWNFPYRPFSLEHKSE